MLAVDAADWAEPRERAGDGTVKTVKCLITFFPATYRTIAAHNGRYIKWWRVMRELGAKSEELDNNNNADNEVSSPLVSSNPAQELYWW